MTDLGPVYDDFAARYRARQLREEIQMPSTDSFISGHAIALRKATSWLRDTANVEGLEDQATDAEELIGLHLDMLVKRLEQTERELQTAREELDASNPDSIEDL